MAVVLSALVWARRRLCRRRSLVGLADSAVGLSPELGAIAPPWSITVLVATPLPVTLLQLPVAVEDVEKPLISFLPGC
ncbi:hypothetical protein PF006_g10120 [Phytophthora fragariae]|uniref:Uncharacterized protein n=1 Tax=Phytophthora fragariae TaxID=53985 RepID=A0A6A3U1J0_9STRA|nr:hypothetical protein PF003_g9753 [Phytophthora fragariae]KAE9144988.1 hypothetical protein PF006_g10120 [Phytophthora fragariae]